MFPWTPCAAPCTQYPVPLLLAALTGNIASGKSEVARMFADLGATVIDADELAREVVRPGTGALASIVSRWGTGILQPDGTLDRGTLRSIVFANAADREALNRIIHPEVRLRRDELIAEARARGDEVVLSVIPLLFETGMNTEFGTVILVDAPEDVRLARLLKRSGLDASEGRCMLAAQMPSSQKRDFADIVIDNDSTLDALREKVENAWKDLLRRR